MRIKFLPFILMCILSKMNAQFSLITLQPNYGNTNANIIGVGVGNWPIFTTTNSRFHINNFFCNVPAGPLNGLLFRTDGSNNVSNNWQLFTGATNASTTEKFKLSVPAGSSDVFLNAVQTNGNMQLQTGSFTRLFIDNSVAVTAGFVGIGQNFTAPKNLLHIHDGSNSYLQVTNGTTTGGAGNGIKFGLLGNTVNGIIGSQEPTGNLYFATAGSGLGQVKMTILPNGNVGIGNGLAFISSINNKLDVDQGDIDVNTSQRSYMIGDSSVLWNKGRTSNIFVGVGAGNNHAFNQNSENTYIGYKSGFMGNGCFIPTCAPFTNTQNTLIGAYAGFNNAASGAVSMGYGAGFTHNGTATQNTFVGYKSGFFTQGTANDNAFFGGKSGENNTTGDFNTFLGNVAGQNSTTGLQNCFIGNACGQNNSIHFNNNYLGHLAGNKSSGDENIFVGTSTGIGGVGNRNVVMGNGAMQTDTLSNENVTIGYIAAPTGNARNFNVIIGSRSTPVLDSCNLNSLIGYKTAFNQTRGLSNAYLGESTGNNVLKGTNNTFIGAKADVTTVNSTTVSNATAIGANAKVYHANHMILGDNNVNVGIGLSADALGPGNKLEINTPAATAIPGVSGLRFRDLNSTSTAIANPSIGVLSVDANGDVIYVLGGGGSGLGGVCSTTPTGLPNNWEIPLNNFNYVFTGQGTTNNNVGIGTNCTPLAKLHVRQASGSVIGSTGLLVQNTDPTSYSVNVIGIKSVVNNPNPGCVKIAGWFQADNSPACGGSVFHQAIFVPDGGGAVTIGYSSPTISISHLLQVNGSAIFGAVTYPSDIGLKNTVTTLPNSLSLVKRLRPVTFKWNTVSDSGMAGVHAGFIAQEIDTVIPQVVRTNPDGIKNIAYTEIIPYLVSAIQSQQKTIDSLTTKANKQDSINNAVQAQIAALTSSVSSCCSSSAIRTTKPNDLNQLDINLTDKDIIVINQNVPNPFAEQTTITYNVPDKYNFAQIIFSTIEGKIIKAVDITKKGKGQLNVFANDLSTGFYSYSLIIDGKNIDTKKMVKSELLVTNNHL